QIEAMRQNNIHYLEIRGVDGKNISELTFSQVKEVSQTLFDAGIETWSIGSPIGKIKITDDFEPHLNCFKRMIETAHILNARCFRIFSFYETGKADIYRDEVMFRLSRFVEESKGSSVILCHENEKEIFGEGYENCLDIVKTIPEIKAVFDPANFVQSGGDPLKAWKNLSPYVEYLHIKDALKDGKNVPVGYGDGNIKEILKLYYEQGGRVITLEPHLSVFDGLQNLEGTPKSEVGSNEFMFQNQREAFDYAASMLEKMIVNL
ncbi:MAG: TIM barrel protein, partial [Oscillospiraceae bacterium]